MPELPERVASIARTTPVWMGAVTKVIMSYPTPFWRNVGLSGSAMSHVGPLREVHDMSGPNGSPAALFGFVPASTIEAPTVTAEAVLAQLIDLFGPAAGRPDVIVIKDWRREQFTSPAEVEHLSDYQTFGHEQFQIAAMNGRLHWTSTETASTFPGHIEGALEAAERTARSIGKHMQPAAQPMKVER